MSPTASPIARVGHRDLFGHLAWSSYLDHAAIGPLPQPALQAGQALLQAQATHGVAAIIEAMQGIDTARATAAACFGIRREDLAFLTNTSAGVSAIAACTDWQPGDRILLLEGEFPTNTTPWQAAAERHGLSIEWLRADAFRDDTGLTQLDALLLEGPIRWAAVSLVQFQTGLRMPVEAIAQRIHAAGGQVFVDAIQGLGVVPFDLRTVDAVAAGGQKWLMGPVGTALLWASERTWHGLVPSLASWLSHQESLTFLTEGEGHLTYALKGARALRQGPASVEGGSLPLALVASFGESLRLLQGLGVQTVFDHIQAWHDRAEPLLTDAGLMSERHAEVRFRSGSLCAKLPADLHLGRLAQGLRDRGLSVSTPDGRLRLAPSWPNALSEVQILADALPQAVADARRAG